MNKQWKAIEKGCTTCLYLCTHEHCTGCLESVGNDYIHHKWEYGTMDQQMSRLHDLEVSGKRSIHVEGEIDIGINTPPEDAYKSLFDVGCECGYFVQHGTWTDKTKEIICYIQHTFVLVYNDNKLHHIDMVCRNKNDDSDIKRSVYWSI